MTTRAPLQRLFNSVFGIAPVPLRRTREPDIAPAEGGTPHPKPVVTTQRASRPLARNAVVPDALRRAIEDLIVNDARAYVTYYPRTRYRIDQVVTHITPENRRYLEELQGLKPRIRNGIALACIAAANGSAEVIDTSSFCDWHIEPAVDGSPDDKDVYTVLAGLGPDQFNLNFMIYGEYVEAVAPSPAAPAPGAADACDDDMSTLELSPLHAPILTLRIQEPGQPERQQVLSELPALIGRGSACTVRLSSPHISRIHACITTDACGQLVLESNSPKGAMLGGPDGPQVDLAVGQAQPLQMEGTITLTPAAGSQAIQIAYQRRLSTTDCTPTLDLPECHPRPDEARSAVGARRVNYLGAADTIALDRAAISPSTSAPLGAAPTLCARSPALARIQVRHGDGQIEDHLIHELPVLIGREPAGNGTIIVLRDPKCQASRLHLRIDKRQGNSFLTENLGQGKGNSWLGGELLGPRFVWRPQAPGARGGWVTLGQRDESSGAVMVRIEHVQ